ncbi:hypothetical protein OH76DRAFT_534410 [Lentinus brumalis]|uniref:Uncharacterized protein n=1 Tax=Lentinus brumalis TaxID=2498619 RepID=A0A371DAD6_9APHY|nr:hypothetical protein OH76DRAFT_534410 [Polyporus brumalis]
MHWKPAYLAAQTCGGRHSGARCGNRDSPQNHLRQASQVRLRLTRDSSLWRCSNRISADRACHTLAVLFAWSALHAAIRRADSHFCTQRSCQEPRWRRWDDGTQPTTRSTGCWHRRSSDPTLTPCSRPCVSSVLASG